MTPRCENMVHQPVGEGEMLDVYWCSVCGVIQYEGHDAEDISRQVPEFFEDSGLPCEQ